MISLKRRLVSILVALILFAWVASAVMTFFYAQGVVLRQVDQQLEQYSDLASYITQVFARQVDEGVPVTEPWFDHQFEQEGRSPMVIDGPGSDELSPALNVFLGSDLLAVLENSPRFEVPAGEGFAFAEVGSEASLWRLLSRYDEDSGLWVLVGVDLEGARWALLGILARALLPLLVVLPLTVVLLYLGVSRGLQPLKNLAGQIASRNQALLEPVATAEVPSEVQGLVAALNDLLLRLATALETEQRFTANAAHELMTPLAAIKTEVQLCQRQMQDPDGREMLARIGQRVDRASHTVEQLLTLARVDPGKATSEAPQELNRLLGEALADTGHLAAGRRLQVELVMAEEVWVVGAPEALSILLRNLLINAFRYADEGSIVQVSLAGPESPSLQISNTCRRLDEENFQRLGDRFYRPPGSEGPGAGLGLSIVARIASQLGAEFNVGPGSDGEGFCARLEFPAAS